MDINSTIEHVVSGRHLSMKEMESVMDQIMDGRCDEEQIAGLLMGLHNKGETVEEVAGAAAAMRGRMTPIRSRHAGLLDTCGTGGDGSKTFNISTAAALVAAAAGVPVAKHGNRGITSRSGSADALAVLGVNIEADVSCVEACLDELGICFCFAPLLHKAMKHVAAVRKKLGTPTVFNILGPLVNPAAAPFQLLGVGRPALQPLMAEALLLLGTRLAVIVHGADGLDEVSLAGPTHVIEARGGTLKHFDWTPDDFGLESAGSETMLVTGPEQSAAIIRDILDNRPGPPRDIVIANAAAALWTAGRDTSLLKCAQLAAETITSGAARELLARLVEQTRSY
ncbi:MAG: anthranilate phosphoribosyltransferase [Thermoguttaceae bacterium]|jgi:anthranilate phosphoribosyltransferase